MGKDGSKSILKDELEREYLEPGRALMVGCGLGDDAIFLEQLGWKVVAFDLAFLH